MTCKFCGQWNAASAKRCVFCQNPLDADEDATAGGAGRATQVTLPTVDQRQRTALGGKGVAIKDLLVWAVVLLVAGVAGLVCRIR